MEVVLALEFIGPTAREAAPDLVRLWQSEGNSEYRSYNGFPLALAMVGNASPGVLSALHQRFESPDRLHGSLCAFAAWRLKPNDATAIARIRRELESRDAYAHARYTLLDDFCRFSSTNIGPFVTQVQSLVAAPCPDAMYQPNVDAAKEILAKTK